MIMAIFWVTLGAMIVRAPLGIAGVVFLSEFVPRPVMRVIKPTIELLAAIHSVVYGFIGVMVLAPFYAPQWEGRDIRSWQLPSLSGL